MVGSDITRDKASAYHNLFFMRKITINQLICRFKIDYTFTANLWFCFNKQPCIKMLSARYQLGYNNR